MKKKMFRNISFFCGLDGMFLKVFHSCVYVFECRFVGKKGASDLLDLEFQVVVRVSCDT